MYAQQLAAAGRMIGGAAGSRAFDITLETGNNTFPRTFSSPYVDARDGAIISKIRSTTGNVQALIKNGSNYRQRSTSTTTGANPTNVTIDASGFTVTSNTGFSVNSSAATYVHYLLAKRAKVFDRVVYAGNGSAQDIAHALGAGSVVGAIWVSKYDSADAAAFSIYHRGMDASPEDYYQASNSTAAKVNDTAIWDSTPPTDTVFRVGASNLSNENAKDHVALVFAHDTGPAGIIQCGSYTGNGNATGPLINLGWPAEAVITRRADGVSTFACFDVLRTPTFSGNDARLNLNNTTQESSGSEVLGQDANGFQILTTSSDYNANGAVYTYIAFRRG